MYRQFNLVRCAQQGAYVYRWQVRHTRLNLRLLGLADDELVKLLLFLCAEVLEALLGLGGDLELVHCECGCDCGW